MIQDAWLIPTLTLSKKKRDLYATVEQPSSSTPPSRTPFHQAVGRHQDCAFPKADTLLALLTPWQRGMRDSRRNFKRVGAGGRTEDSRSRDQLQSVRNP